MLRISKVSISGRRYLLDNIEHRDFSIDLIFSHRTSFTLKHDTLPSSSWILSFLADDTRKDLENQSNDSDGIVSIRREENDLFFSYEEGSCTISFSLNDEMNMRYFQEIIRLLQWAETEPRYYDIEDYYYDADDDFQVADSSLEIEVDIVMDY